ncbi:hypothetical protein GXM_02381 [Nostoc sphaeroides CCNUC1]|uniref:Uncharacterized protein n=1 Tax=Nostoc sphaeroides CCNUC1 TaxID=2653204 RepID=A0A5P8VXQ1_9NOSO|nr:hypothetical protein GXM_02381 [Nostoc sphaeroides CCNUC1]
MTTNPQLLAGVATAFPDDSSFDFEEVAGIDFVMVFILKCDGCR